MSAVTAATTGAALAAAILVGGCAISTKSAERQPVDDASAAAAAPAAAVAATTAADDGARTWHDDREIPETPQWSAAESLQKGIEWLLANQNPDGSWGTFHTMRTREIYLDNAASHRAFHTATSALCAQALIEGARTDSRAQAALERGVEHLLTQEMVGAASASTFYDVWAHTYQIDLGVRLLEEPGWEPKREALLSFVQREVNYSLLRQGIDGGWGYYDFQGSFERPTGNETTSFNTASMILALDGAKRVGVRVDEERRLRAIKRLELFRLPDGAFVYGTYARYRPGTDFNRPSGSSGRLQSCQLALFENGAGGVGQSQLAEGLAHLREKHHYIEIGRGRPMPHEAFYRNSGYYYFYGHYHAARVIGALENAEQREVNRLWLDDLMRRIQHPDGTWFDYPLYGYGHAYATGYGVLIMQHLARIAPPQDQTAQAAEVDAPGAKSATR